MISAGQLEKLILEAVARRGIDGWADSSLGDLKNRVADAAGLVSPNAPSDTGLVDVLVSLEKRGLISIEKVVEGGRIRTYEQLQTIDGLENFTIFQRGTFRLKLTHDGRKALEEQAESSSSKSSGEIIFISCGQETVEEKDLGNAVAKLIETLTPYKAYFAQNESTLEGVTENILKALNRAVGLIAIMHPRGRVIGLEEQEHIRASVWIEQEIAIASFVSQALGKPLNVAVCVHREIKREGLRDKLHLNPIQFDSSKQVLEHLRKILRQWQGLASTKEVGLRLEADIGYEVDRKENNYHDYDLVVSLKNTGEVTARDYCVRVLFPRAFIRPNSHPSNLVGNKGTQSHALFELRHDYRGITDFYPGDDIKAVIKIPYRIEEDARVRYPESLKQLVMVTVYSGDMKPQKTEKPMSELLDIL